MLTIGGRGFGFGGFDIYEIEGKDKFGLEIVLEKRVGDVVTVVIIENAKASNDTRTRADESNELSLNNKVGSGILEKEEELKLQEHWPPILNSSYLTNLLPV